MVSRSSSRFAQAIQKLVSSPLYHVLLAATELNSNISDTNEQIKFSPIKLHCFSLFIYTSSSGIFTNSPHPESCQAPHSPACPGLSPRPT